MLTLVFPTQQHRDDVLAFYAEFEANNQTCIGYSNHADFDKWLLGMQNRKAGKGLPQGWARENFYLCYDDEQLVGVFSLKLELTPYLHNLDGHVGYAVAPSRRNRGLAIEILRQGLDIARSLDFDRILAVCDEDNCASETVILRNGGVFEDKRFDAKENVFVKRFWITL